MFGVGMGPNSQEKQQYNTTNATSGFATGVGEGDLTASSAFLRDILSGDPTKIGTALAPQVSAAVTQAQQAKKTNSEFGTRSGGTTAANANADAATRTNYLNLAGGMTSGAASALASEGSSLLSTGLSGTEAAFDESKTMHDQNAAKWDDLFNSITSVAAAPFTGGASLGMGKLGMPGGGKGMDPGSFSSLMDAGTVKPATLDTSSLFSF